ncbi:DNA polymerase III subunit delta' [Halanaerobacter jeridensis]|uniref:DNA polymerase III subunit delta' n=1 Tax=Halanaerobacter jeridensis TaxID=706427 RepID=A0A939BPM1_9FIRM|nr:DNA polymerase III subunit delta' [Halanaerobacter jeridensis]MBM7557242.1 DNA polymerase-3 subunit delta' [Halanaerobacter jeridensis]
MSFDNVLGQETVITILQNALNKDRLSHAYIFTGKQGVGKGTTAFEFAKAANCHNQVDDACDECLSCRKANNDNHPDIKEIKAEGASIKIEQIRELQQEIMYKPYESKKKVYIIYQAEDMTLSAANSLLKTLEEPPSYAIIILLTNNLNQLLATTISRCQLVRFKRIPYDLIKENLIEDYDLTAAKGQLIASLADGRYDYACQLIEDEEQLERREDVIEFLVNFPNIDKVQLFEKVQDLLNYKDEINQILEVMITWYRDLLLLDLGQEDKIINADYLDELKHNLVEFEAKEIEKIIEVLENSNELIKNYNVNLRLSLEVMLLKLKRVRRF